MENDNYTEITYIYILKDVNSVEPRYVGKSNDPISRFKRHIYDTKRSKSPTYKERWIRKVFDNGGEIEFYIIDICKLSEYVEFESKWIRYFNEVGYRLTNSDDTGQGNKGRKREIIDRAITKISKKVFKFDLNGVFICEYKSSREAARSLGISHGNIVKCCNGVFKHTMGYIFRYDRDSYIDPITEPNAVKKEVMEVDINGKIIETWSSICECSNKTNILSCHISRCCNNKLKSIKGRYFQFKS